MPVYSHSRLSTFEQCPLKFKFRYIDYVEPDFYNGMPVPYDEGEVNPNLTKYK